MKTELISEKLLGEDLTGLVFHQYRVLPAEGIQAGEIHEYSHPNLPTVRVVTRILLLPSGWNFQLFAQDRGECVGILRERLNAFENPSDRVRGLKALLRTVFFPSSKMFTLKERLSAYQSDGHSV